jgi:hypothetical protein
MDVQAAPPPYIQKQDPRPIAGNPPVLGSQTPGTSGGLPAQGGLTALANPMAQELQSYGRGEDTMLVHMTPGEVNSLQGLAMASGGSLTINPNTGLPEAGWLGKLLPTILGAAGMAFGIPPVWMGALGAAGGTIATGDLGKGLMAGLQAYGGASLGGAAGIGGKLGSVGKDLGLSGANAISGAGAAASKAANAGIASNTGAAASNAAGTAGTLASKAATTGLAANTGGPGFFSNFAQASRAGLPGGIIGKAAPMLAAQGVLSGVSSAMTPGYTNSSGQIDNSYQGPYTAQERKATFAPSTEEMLSSSKERNYFDVSQPEIYNMQGQVVQPGSNTAPGTMIYQNVVNSDSKGRPLFSKSKNGPMFSSVGAPYMGRPLNMGYAEGGEVELADGAFVVDARTVSELGNGSSNAGIDALSRMGGRPVRGPGDGVSDSIPARIGRDQPARVARDEVIFPPQAVQRIGKGDGKRGAQKLYALMEKAHNARKKSERGKDTKLRKGLA